MIQAKERAYAAAVNDVITQAIDLEGDCKSPLKPDMCWPCSHVKLCRSVRDVLLPAITALSDARMAAIEDAARAIEQADVTP
jgi:hypothetical protein